MLATKRSEVSRCYTKNLREIQLWKFKGVMVQKDSITGDNIFHLRSSPGSPRAAVVSNSTKPATSTSPRASLASTTAALAARLNGMAI